MLKVVCNICGKAKYQFKEILENHMLICSRIVGWDNTIYSEGKPNSMPSHIVEREKHEGFSYLSKFYALKDCVDRGETRLLWVDACVHLHEPLLKSVNNHLDEHGCLLIQSNSLLKKWCTDRFCRIINKDRKDLDHNLIIGGVFGFDLNHPAGKDFYDNLEKLTKEESLWFGPCGIPWRNEDVGTEQLSMDTSVKGHRHDQAVMSFIVKELMKEKPLMFQTGELGPHFYSQEYINQEYEKDPSKDAYYFPAEASFTHHPTKYHHEGTLIR